MDLNKLLNKNQFEAANTFDGPIMVFAGAGSGKTRTLTYRVASMIESGISPYNILAITFTNKATNEMKARLYDVVGGKIKFATISTFHSLCARILRQEIEVLGYRKDFEIIDEDDQIEIIKDALEIANIDKKKFTPKQMRKMINYHKCFNLKPVSPIEQKVYNTYEQLMKELSKLDFDRVIYLGSNSYKAIARESALKLLELTSGIVNANYDTPLGFRHGPKSVINNIDGL